MNSSRKISPGWIANIFFDVTVVALPLVVIDDLNFVRVALAPHKAPPVLDIDPNAVLPLALPG
jgi:hypothetical protein